MRRTLFMSLGLLELLAALVLFAFAWQLPGPPEVRDTVGRVEKVSTRASSQVKRLRGQVKVLRERQPQLQQLAGRLRQQLELVDANLKSQTVDPGTVVTMSDALGDVARGLDGLSETAGPEGATHLGKGLGATADYLDGKVAPGAEKAAERLEESTKLMRQDAERLAGLLRAGPLDLRAARAVSEALGKFDEGLGRMVGVLKVENFEAIREGFKGLETSLGSGANQVEKVADYTYPSVRFEGRRPVVEQKPFWPEGKATAEGMRKASKGVTAAGKDLDRLHKELPKLRASLTASRQVVTSTRQALDVALKQQEQVEPLLKDVPMHAAQLAEELPQIGGDLAKVLRETAKLRAVAVELRQAQKATEAAAARWPQLQGGLARSAVLLRATQQQLQTALERRDQFKAGLEQTLLLTRAFAAALPLLTEQLEEHLLQQEQSLAELGDSLDEVSAALPACASTASRLLVTTKLLLALVGAVVTLHGFYLVLSARLGHHYSA
jgi:hypothetical protein